MVNLAFVSRAEIPSKNASSVSVVQMANSFSKKDIKVTLYSKLKSQDSDKINSFYGVNSNFKHENYITSSFPTLVAIGFIFKIINSIFLSYKLNKSKVDMVYARDIFSLLLLKNPFFIYECHKPFNNVLEYVVLKIINQRKNFTKMVCISNELKKIILHSNKELDESKLLVAHDAASISLNIPHKNKNLVVGYAGSLHKGRGISLIIKLAGRFPDLKFVVIGGNSNYIIDKKISPNMLFIPHQPHSKLNNILNKMDILVAPYQKNLTILGKKNTSSYLWMSPLKIFEYMALGKSIICSDFRVIREVLRNGENSLLIKYNNFKMWESALRTLSTNRKLRENLGEVAKADFLNKYTWDARVKLILESFQND